MLTRSQLKLLISELLLLEKSSLQSTDLITIRETLQTRLDLLESYAAKGTPYVALFKEYDGEKQTHEQQLFFVKLGEDPYKLAKNIAKDWLYDQEDEGVEVEEDVFKYNSSHILLNLLSVRELSIEEYAEQVQYQPD